MIEGGGDDAIAQQCSYFDCEIIGQEKESLLTTTRETAVRYSSHS